MTTHVLKPLAIALLLGIAPLSISTAYAVAGPAGATGARGDTGLTGPAGANGANGSNGSQGIQGLRGLAGTNGTNGTNGATGAQGLTGAIGPSRGVKGDTGAAGAIGPIGLPGPAGSAAVHVIGDSYAGGIVFWVDASGEHGLIAARADQSEAGVQWYNGTYRVIRTNGDGIGAGVMNTALIIAAQSNDNPANFAATVAADYSVQDNGVNACTVGVEYAHPPVSETCYGDWYLPSKVELNLLYNAKNAGVVGGFNDQNFWSSTQGDINGAWIQNFTDGYQRGDLGMGFAFRVRAVRAF